MSGPVIVTNRAHLATHLAVLDAHGLPYTVRTVDEHSDAFGSSREYVVDLHDTTRRAVIEPWPNPQDLTTG